MKNKLVNYFNDISSNRNLMIFIIITLSIYLPSLYFDFFVFDDKANIIEDSKIRGLSDLLGPWSITKIPLSYNYWQIVNFIFGNSTAAPFRALNIVFHIFNGLLVYRIAKKYVTSSLLSTFIIGIFLIHPINVQSVVWVSSSREILATLMILISANFFMASDLKDRGLLYSIFFWVLSLLFKPIGVVIPLLIPLFSREKNLKRVNILVGAGFCLAALTLFLYIGEIEKAIPGNNFSKLNYLASYVITSIIYLKNYFLPFSLSYNYSITPSTIDTIFNSTRALYYFIPLLIILIFAFKSKDKKITAPLISFFLLITINSGLIPFNHQLISIVTDRYLYLPSIALVFLLIGVSSHLKRHFKVLLVSFSLVLIPISYNQVSKWKTSSDRLYTPTYTNHVAKMSYLTALIWDRKYSKASLLLEKYLESNEEEFFFDYLSVRLSLFNSIPKDQDYHILRSQILDNLPQTQKEFFPLIANFAYQNKDFRLARTALFLSKKSENFHLVDFDIDTLDEEQLIYEDKVMTETTLIPFRRNYGHVGKRLYKTLRPMIQDKKTYDQVYKER